MPENRHVPLLAVAAVAAVLAGCSASCVDCRAQPVAETILRHGCRQRRVPRLRSVGARSVKVLLIRPPSIVLLREVFVPRAKA
jgi:hypothetical protein